MFDTLPLFRRLLIIATVVGASAVCTAAQSPDYGEVAATCTRAAQTTQTINLSSGVYTERAVVNAPISITIPSGYDTNEHANCLEREGFNAKDLVVAQFKRLDTCQALARPSSTVTIAKGTPRIAAVDDLDPSFLERCANGDVAVEVDIPAETR